MSKLPNEATVVVATGTVAKYFHMKSNQGDAKLEFVRETKPGDLADQGPSGKSPPERSAPESMEATFSNILANRLFDQAHAGEFDNLILIADPETLGEMRPLLHQEVTDKIAFELNKTLINAPIEDIEKSIDAASG